MTSLSNSRVLRTIPLLIAFCLVSLPAQAQYGGGAGEPNDPYLIYTTEQMNEIGLHEEDWHKHFKLMADIDLSSFTGTDFNIIGYFVSRDNKPFTGVFDGNGQYCDFLNAALASGDITIGSARNPRWHGYRTRIEQKFLWKSF